MRSLLIALCLAGSMPADACPAGGEEIPGLPAALRSFYARDLEAAERALLEVERGHPEYAEVVFYLGRVYLEQGRAKDAVQTLERAIGLDPERSSFHFWLAEALVRRIDEVPFLMKLPIANRMRTAYEEAVRLDPENLEALISVARFHAAAPAMAGGSPEKAVSHLAEIRRRNPALALVTRGLSEEQLGRLEAAENELRAAVELDPQSVVSWRELGYFYQRRERWRDALDAFEQALAREPGDPLSLYEAGRLSVRLGEQLLARARETLRSYLEIEPGPVPRVLGAADPPIRATATRALERVDAWSGGVEAWRKPLARTEGWTDFPLVDAARVD